MPHPVSLTCSLAASSLRLAVLASILCASVAFAGRFDLPKANPQISIQIPDDWQPDIAEDTVTAHPANNTRAMISVFAISGAGTLQDAFTVATKRVSALYGDVKIGKLAEQKQAGITFFGGQGEGEKDGFELTLAIAAFTGDGKHFFGLAWARDEAAGETITGEINKALGSIQLFRESSKPPK